VAILYGIGRPIITVETGLAAARQRVLLPIEPMSFSLQASVDLVKSTKYNTEGVVVTAGSAKRKIDYELTLGIEAITWATMQMALGELDQATTNAQIGSLRFATLPTTGVQEISDSSIPAVPAKVSAAVYGDDKPMLLRGVTGTPAAGQFSVAAGKITVGPGAEGKPIGYRLLLTEPTCRSIGVEDANLALLNNLSFEGVLQTDSPNTTTKIYIPNMQSDSEASISVDGVTKFELKYSLVTPAGRRRPYDLYNIDKV
jgi:hypothetical protein